MGFYCSQHAWLGFCALKEGHIEGSLPTVRDLALIALRAGTQARQVEELGAKFQEIQLEVVRIETLRMEAERDKHQARAVVQAASSTVELERRKSNAEVQNAREELSEVI
jgi:hypothetical protein